MDKCAKDNKYNVKYVVDGFGEQTAGPYSLAEAEYHMNDIRDFEGVLCVTLVEVTDENGN